MSRERNDLFSTTHLRKDLKERAVRSTGITLVSQVLKLILQLGSMAILARLLEPDDFGLVAMVAVFTGLALQFMEGGLSMATIQRNDITHHQVSNLFWVNAALGAVLCLLGILISPLVASIYNEPRIAMIMVAMSFTFLIGGVSVQHDALLRRQMRFKELSIIDIMSMTFGVVAGITAAIIGLQYWALVISPIVTFSTISIMRWWSVRWVPSMINRGSGVRPLLNFGANLTGANFIGYISNNVTPFAVGLIGGAQSLGLFNRANTLTSLPSSQLLPPIINVLQPTVARIANDPLKLKKTIISLMGKLALVSSFITVVMALLADWIVLILLGSIWEGAIPIFRFLAVYTFIQPLAGLIAVVLIASGEAKALMISRIHSLAITIFALLIGSIWGADGAILAFSIGGLFVRLPIFLYYASKFLPLSFVDFCKPILPAFLCSFLTIITIIWLRGIVEVNSPIEGLILFLPACVLVYLLACFLIKPARSDVFELIAIIRFGLLRKTTKVKHKDGL